MGNDLDGRRILWGVGSPRTMRAQWALHERFAALNPRGKIPVLQDGDFTIAESAAIIAYLAEAYGEEQRLVPAGGRARAQWLEWSAFICMELDATALYVIRRHVGLPQIYGEAPAAVEAARSYFVKQLGCVDQALRDERRYLMGDDFTTADILLGTCLAWAIRLKVPVCESGQAYLGRVTARAAYPKALAANAVRPEQTPAPK